jgi:hypothetical protein
MGKHEDLTQLYSTWGNKLLQHTDVLHSIQKQGHFRPITVQLAPVEACDSDCPFCSVGDRPLRSRMKAKQIYEVLMQFRAMGAKSVEITGGGNPLLWRGEHDGTSVGIGWVIEAAHRLGYEIGVITNSESLERIPRALHPLIEWVRVSLIKLDEGKDPEDYDFGGLPYSKLGFSYIIYDKTTPETIRRIARLVELHPEVKFVRLAGDCLIKGNNAEVAERFRPVVDEVDRWGKFFIKDIGHDDGPFDEGCYVGALRPYVAPDPNGSGRYCVYICTSHVLQKRTYDLDYALCEATAQGIMEAWAHMDSMFREYGFPYEVRSNGGKGWCETCQFCFYKNNNRLLHTVAHPMPDGSFA